MKLELLNKMINQTNQVWRPEESAEKWVTLVAENIAKECINKIETYDIPVGHSPASEMAYEMTCRVLKNIVDDIKEHFGVE